MSMRCISGLVIFQHMREAFDARAALEEAGFAVKILHEVIDDFSDAGFMRVARYADCDDGPDEAPVEGQVRPRWGNPALDAFDKQVRDLIAPFLDADLDEVGFRDLSEPSFPEEERAE
jgi:hypothetical protein